MELPKNFREKMEKWLGTEYQAYLHSLNQDEFHGLRINTLKISPSRWKEKSPFLLEPVPWIENGYYYNMPEENPFITGEDLQQKIEEQPAKSPYYYAGLYYIQEPSAMVPASRLPIMPGDKVLDLCAAPGGKSTELGAKLKGKGVLVSNDISNTRAKALLKNLELFGITNIIVSSESPKKLEHYFSHYFDKILVDAPCSGEGMFRRENSMVKNWEQSGPIFYQKIQREILDSAVNMLKPGGFLLYSTCTFSTEENEENVQYILDKYEDFSVEQMEMGEGFDCGKTEWIENGSLALKNCARLWPHKLKGEGHFAALLKKKNQMGMENEVLFDYKIEKRLVLGEEVEAFFKMVSFQIDWERCFLQDNRLYLLPEQIPSLKGLRLLRSGLLLGEIKTKRFEPSQAFAMSLKKNEFSSVIDFSIDDPNVIKYLKGETLFVENAAKGWQLICVEGFPLGWGKCNQGVLKNKYYKGWRFV